MKKFLILLLIVVLLGGTAFFFGWVSFRVEGSEYAIAFTKSDGWIAEPITPGSFRWMWQALIPTNLTLHRFPLTPTEITLDESGTLPSASLYRRYVEGEPSFDYSLELTLSYRLEPLTVAEALGEERTTPEDIDSYRESMEGELKSAARSAVVSAIEALGEDPEVGALSTVSEEVLEELQDAVEQLEILDLTIREAELPDPFVYQTARENYQAIQEGRREGLRETARSAAAQRVLDEERRKGLEEYGRILQEYPVLLDYFRLAAESGTDPLNLEPVQSALEEAE
ncbi:MAG: hypothetical protein ACLFNP_10075 [Spirochaetaceae bacterium]